MKELVVLLPAYNEEENVEKMIKCWLKGVDKVEEQFGLYLRIVIINDGSSDRTYEIAKRLSCENSRITVCNHEKNKGLGEAVKTGFSYVVNECPKAMFACLMDCDNTQHPKYVLSMLKKIGMSLDTIDTNQLNGDVVIASRYEAGAKVKGVASYRLLTSQGARLVYGEILRVPGVKDYTCGYRLYTREILTKAFVQYGERFIEESGFTCMAEVLYKLHVVGAKFLEVPFVLRYDQKEGSSKMKVVKTAVNSVGLALRLKLIKQNK